MNSLIISPTGEGIRCDSLGSGSYGSPRGDRIHQGIDFICSPGQEVVCPIDNAKVVRLAYPYRDQSYNGVLLRSPIMEVMMFYLNPIEEIYIRVWMQGDVIGYAQNISRRYSPNMIPHIHLDIRSIDPILFLKED